MTASSTLPRHVHRTTTSTALLPSAPTDTRAGLSLRPPPPGQRRDPGGGAGLTGASGAGRGADSRQFPAFGRPPPRGSLTVTFRYRPPRIISPGASVLRELPIAGDCRPVVSSVFPPPAVPRFTEEYHDIPTFVRLVGRLAGRGIRPCRGRRGHPFGGPEYSPPSQEPSTTSAPAAPGPAAQVSVPGTGLGTVLPSAGALPAPRNVPAGVKGGPGVFSPLYSSVFPFFFGFFFFPLGQSIGFRHRGAHRDAWPPARPWSWTSSSNRGRWIWTGSWSPGPRGTQRRGIGNVVAHRECLGGAGAVPCGER